MVKNRNDTFISDKADDNFPSLINFLISSKLMMIRQLVTWHKKITGQRKKLKIQRHSPKAQKVREKIQRTNTSRSRKAFGAQNSLIVVVVVRSQTAGLSIIGRGGNLIKNLNMGTKFCGKLF